MVQQDIKFGLSSVSSIVIIPSLSTSRLPHVHTPYFHTLLVYGVADSPPHDPHAAPTPARRSLSTASFSRR